MKNMAEQITEQFTLVAERESRRAAEKWYKFSRQRLVDFQSIYRTALERLESLSGENAALTEAWKELLAMSDQLYTFTGTLGNESDQYMETLFQDCSEEISEVRRSFPASIRIPLPDGYWDPHPDDTLRMRVWKRVRHSGEFIKRFSMVTANLPRRLTGKPLRIYRRSSRKFDVHSFIESYLELPFRSFLLDHGEAHCLLEAKHLQGLSKIFEGFSISVLGLENAAEIWQKNEAGLLGASLAGERLNLEIVAQLHEELRTFKTGFRKDLGNWLEETLQNFHRKWHFAGTFVLPGYHFGSRKTKRFQSQLSVKKTAYQKTWTTHFSGRREDWRNDILLKKIQIKSADVYIRVLGLVGTRISKQVLPVFEKANKLLSNSREKFQRLKPEGRKDLRKAIISENRSLLSSLRKEILPETVDTLIGAQLEHTIEQVVEEVRTLVEALPEKQMIFSRLDLDRHPPESEIDEVPLKELLDKKILTSFTENLKALQKEIHQATHLLLQDISELDQVVEFNLEAALTLLEQEQVAGDARNTVVEGIERAEKNVTDFTEKVLEIQRSVEQRLIEAVSRFAGEVQQLLDNEQLIALKIQLLQAKARERYRTYRRRVWSALKITFPKAGAYTVAGWRFIIQHYARFRQMTGLSETIAPGKEELFRSLLESQQKIAALPYVYRRLFQLEPLTDERFFSGREAEISLVRNDFRLWQTGQPISMAVVGERGSGRTTFLNFVEQDVLRRTTIKKLDFQKTVCSETAFLPYLEEIFPECRGKNLAEIEHLFLQFEKPVVCLVENIQNLFLKTVEGFDLLEQFLSLVSHTSGKIFWLVSCTLYSWQYLDKVLNISRYFQRVLILSAIERHEMEKVVIKRHRVTGYHLVFDIPENLQRSRNLKKLNSPQEQQEYLRNYFFEQLEELAKGNISTAILFWLKSIQSVEDNRLLVSPVIKFDPAYIYQLPVNTLFTLGAFLQHEMLTVTEHAEVFQEDVSQSRHSLKNLANRGILLETPGGYRIHPLLYRTVVQVLQTKNIIH